MVSENKWGTRERTGGPDRRAEQFPHLGNYTLTPSADVTFGYLLLQIHQSVICNTNVHTQPFEIFGNVYTPFCIYADLQAKCYGDRPRGTPPSGVKRKRGRPNIAILDLSEAISRKRCKMRPRLQLMTNRKLYP